MKNFHRWSLVFLFIFCIVLGFIWVFNEEAFSLCTKYYQKEEKEEKTLKSEYRTKICFENETKRRKGLDEIFPLISQMSMDANVHRKKKKKNTSNRTEKREEIQHQNVNLLLLLMMNSWVSKV